MLPWILLIKMVLTASEEDVAQGALSLQLKNEMHIQLRVQRKTKDDKRCENNECLPSDDDHNAEELGGTSWCRYDSQDKPEDAERDWNICKDDQDLDELMSKQNDIKKQQLREENKATKKVQKTQKELSSSIQNIDKFNQEQNTLKDEQKLSQKIQSEIEDNEEKIKTLGNRLQEVKNQVASIQKLKANLNPKDSEAQTCDGQLLYEEPRDGNGIIAHFYNNENFEGEPQKKEIEEVDLKWLGQKPTPETDAFTFSVILKGKMNVPLTDQYTFIIDTDQAVQLKINGEIMIDHYVSDRKKGWKGKEMGNEVRSEPFQLDSASLYAIEIKYWTAQEFSNDESGARFIRLSWESKFIRKTKPILFNDYDTKQFTQSYIRSFDTFFQDKPHLIMDDVPKQHMGAIALKTDAVNKANSFKFNITQKGNLFLAISENKLVKNYVPKEFKYTGEKMTMLDTDPTKVGFTKDQIQDVPVRKSEGFYIFAQHNAERGEHEYSFPKPEDEEFPFVIWASLSPGGDQEQESCGGKKILLTSDSKYFAGCEVTGQEEASNCETIFNEETPKFKLEPSKHGNDMQYKLTLKEKFKITEVNFNSGQTFQNNIKRFQVIYDDEVHQEFDMAHKTQIIVNQTTPKMSQQITIKILSLHDQQQAVIGNWLVQGYLCSNASRTEDDEPDQYSFQCGENLFNNPQTMDKEKKIGQFYNVQCTRPCESEKDNIVVEGYQLYTEKSDICGLATHMGYLDEKNKQFTIELVKPQGHFISIEKHGVLSKKSEGVERFSIKPFKQEQQTRFEPFRGMQVDMVGKYEKKEGTITDVKPVDIGKWTLKIETADQQSFDDTWPSEDLKFCGDYLLDRVCDEGSKNPQIRNFFQLNVCFTLYDTCGSEDMFPQNGSTVDEQHKKIYGWAHNVKNFIRCKDKQRDRKDDCYAVMNPRGENIKNNMFVVENVPRGYYRVTIGVHDDKNVFLQNLQIQTTNFIKLQQVNKEPFEKSQLIEVSSGKIQITDKCKDDDDLCDKVESRISYIRIQSVYKPPQRIPGEEFKEEDNRPEVYCKLEEDPRVEGCFFNDLMGRKQKLCKDTFKFITIPKEKRDQKKDKNIYVCMKQQYEFKEKVLCDKYCPDACKKLPDPKFFGCVDEVNQDDATANDSDEDDDDDDSDEDNKDEDEKDDSSQTKQKSNQKKPSNQGGASSNKKQEEAQNKDEDDSKEEDSKSTESKDKAD